MLQFLLHVTNVSSTDILKHVKPNVGHICAAASVYHCVNKKGATLKRVKGFDWKVEEAVWDFKVWSTGYRNADITLLMTLTFLKLEAFFFLPLVLTGRQQKIGPWQQQPWEMSDVTEVFGCEIVLNDSWPVAFTLQSSSQISFKTLPMKNIRKCCHPITSVQVPQKQSGGGLLLKKAWVTCLKYHWSQRG